MSDPLDFLVMYESIWLGKLAVFNEINSFYLRKGGVIHYKENKIDIKPFVRISGGLIKNLYKQREILFTNEFGENIVLYLITVPNSYCTFCYKQIPRLSVCYNCRSFNFNLQY